MLTFGSIVIGVRDVAGARDFWSAALDYTPRDPGPDAAGAADPTEDAGDGPDQDGPDQDGPDEDGEETHETWSVLLPRSGVGPQLVIAESASDPQDQPRVHLDLYADDRASEVARLVELGATEVDPDALEGADFVVMADPDGNRFCVIDKLG